MRHVQIETEEIKIYKGLAAEVIIRYEDIERIELSNKTPLEKNYEQVSLLGNMEEHNLILHLKKTIDLVKLFGIKRKADTLLFYVDQPNLFLKQLSLKLEN